MRPHRLAPLLVASFALPALADGLPDGVGVRTPNGSTFASEVFPVNDVDDFVFQGYPGTVLTASVKAAKGSTLVPEIQVLRPGGEVVTDDEGLALTLSPKSASARFTLDAVGWWKVRVLGADLDPDPAVVSRSQGAYSVGVRYTAPKLAPSPQPSKSFKTSAAISPAGDLDAHRFQGYAGQSFTATLSVPRTSALDPALQLVRPDGTVAASAGVGDTEKKLTIPATLDASGLWELRVVGEEVDPAAPHDDLTTGAYSLTVKLGKSASPGLVPDENGQYRLTLPAVGGASVSYVLSFEGAAPVYNSMVDPSGQRVATFPGGTTVKGFTLPATLPIGEYVITFDAPATPPTGVTFTPSIKLPRGDKKRVAKLSRTEPALLVDGIRPSAGGPGTVVDVRANSVVDEFDQDGSPRLFLGKTELVNVTLLPDGLTVRGTVPPSLPQGVFDVVVESTTGQPGARADAFTRVPPPKVSSIDPTVGTGAGGFELTITGAGFRSGRMGILIDGDLVPVTPTETTEATVKFMAPPRAPGFVVFGVLDRDSGLFANLPLNSFEYVATPAISRIVPGLVPVLGNEVVSIKGANFKPTDHVYLETAPGSGVYDEITATQPTYVNDRMHQFVAPPRTKGVYRTYVQEHVDPPSLPGPVKPKTFVYYTFADFTASSGLNPPGADKRDAWTTALGDYDLDGDDDLFLSRRGTALTPETTSQTRVLRNNGAGVLSDVTSGASGVMPAPGADDWRADRVWASDVNMDGYPDIVIATNAVNVPPAGRSHTRLLVNEPRGGGGPEAADRVFRDRTLDIMAIPRTMQKYGYGSGSGAVYVADDWRAQDMWVGDIDRGQPGPPEIVITHDEVKNDDNYNTDVFSSGVYCGNYCSTQGGFPYNYTFYWGGSRLFLWDKAARAGQGRYKFDPNFFPRSSGPVVPQYLPGGGTIPPCSPHYGRVCKGTFTPFTGQRLAVGNIDLDSKPDVAVLSNAGVKKNGLDIPSLQVGINRFNAADGASVTDMASEVASMGGDFKGDAVAIGQPGFPDGNSAGVIAVAKASGGSSALRLAKFKTGIGVGTFEEITSLSLPVPSPTDSFQASQIRFIDVDEDGDQDLVLLAPAAPGGNQTALRILRNEGVNNQVGVFRTTLVPLLAPLAAGTDRLDGQALAIGDLTGDGLLDYVITRATTTGVDSQTRVIRTDK